MNKFKTLFVNKKAFYYEIPPFFGLSNLRKNRTFENAPEEANINKNIHKIGKLDSITLATRIIARSADIKVDKNIKKGLHLLLTYYPERENIYIQMFGRTARQDEKGSYSEITRSVKNFADVAEVKVDPIKKIYHDVTEHFYKRVPSDSTDKNLAIRWTLFSCLMQHLPRNEIDQNKMSRKVLIFPNKKVFHAKNEQDNDELESNSTPISTQDIQNTTDTNELVLGRRCNALNRLHQANSSDETSSARMSDLGSRPLRLFSRNNDIDECNDQANSLKNDIDLIGRKVFELNTNLNKIIVEEEQRK
ncbi:unnamed protein product [Didymodactylos carnosus]|uniref:Uncharacterized protein n=1 Tax=Didymodactylos carnosus TaxID=1234261 RepID=A0A813WIW2_9BILA|nr:unnamed protein product [Didymodactylos carnosus]CAF1574720.1 unnamed protein product [Didymodactylos carnosus]CAF3640584.1 unnamed protein product [Didymodactylos carnosus]CAF4370960.1 unnamed protein product [Didymodactylos carnosus]